MLGYMEAIKNKVNVLLKDSILPSMILFEANPGATS